MGASEQISMLPPQRRVKLGSGAHERRLDGGILRGELCMGVGAAAVAEPQAAVVVAKACGRLASGCLGHTEVERLR